MHQIFIAFDEFGKAKDIGSFEIPPETKVHLMPYTLFFPEHVAVCIEELRAKYNLPAVTKRARSGSPVYSPTMKRVFASGRAAANALGVSATMISQHMRHPERYAHIRGHTFMKVKDYKEWCEKYNQTIPVELEGY